MSSASIADANRRTDALPVATSPLLRFLGDELAPTPRRLRLASRTALLTTTVVGLSTAMQIAGPWAALVAFNLGLPGLHVGPSAALLIVAVAAFVQAAIVRIAGMIIDAPWLVLFFFFSVVGSGAALAISSRIPVAWILLNVGINAILYTALFSPYAIGWLSAYVFSGIAVAAAVLALFETVLWPVDEEPALRHSLAGCLRAARVRLAGIGRVWSADPGDAVGALLPLDSKLDAHLKLLEGVESKYHDERRTARMFAEISQVERIALAVERLAFLAAPRSRNLPAATREEADDALRAAEETIEWSARRVEATPKDPGLDDGIANLRAALARLAAAEQRARAEHRIDAVDESNVDALRSALELLGDVVGTRPDVPPAKGAAAAAPRSLASRLSPDAMRYGFKVGLASAIGLLIGLFANRASLSVILWTVLIASLPGYGATVRKMSLRLLGAFAGGVLALVAVIVVSASYDSMLAYLLVVVGVTWIGSYVAQSSDRLSYAGIQLTNTFVILYVALEPKASEYDALWRFWGVILGTLSVTFVELIVWPERTGPRLRSVLGRAMRTAAGLCELPGLPVAASQVRRVEIDFLAELRHAAGLAGEARLEGAKTGVDAATAVDAIETLRRVAYRLIGVGLAPRSAMTPEVGALRVRIARGLHARLLALADSIDPAAPRAHAAADDELEMSVARLQQQLAGTDRIEAESYGRVVALLRDLEGMIVRLAKV